MTVNGAAGGVRVFGTTGRNAGTFTNNSSVVVTNGSLTLVGYMTSNNGATITAAAAANVNFAAGAFTFNGNCFMVGAGAFNENDPGAQIEAEGFA